MALIFELVLIASVMVLTLTGLIYLIERKMKTYTHAFLLGFAFLMMGTMFIGAIIYMYFPTTFSLGIAVAINMVPMIIVLAAFFSVADNLSRGITDRKVIYLLSVSIVVDEVLMGSTFQIAQFGKFSSPLQGIDSSLNSVWFFYPMMVEMFFLFFVKVDEMSGSKTPVFLLPIIAVAALPPTLIDVSIWKYFSSLIDLTIAGFGLLTSPKSWKFVYSAICIAVISALIGADYLFGSILALSMVYYYSSTFAFSDLKEKDRELMKKTE